MQGIRCEHRTSDGDPAGHSPHTRQGRWIEKLYFDLEAPLYSSPIPFTKAVYTVPEGPGLGLDVDPSVVETYRVKSE